MAAMVAMFSYIFSFIFLVFHIVKETKPTGKNHIRTFLVFRLSVTGARGSKPVRTHELYLIVNNTGNSTRFDFLDDATDEVTKVKNGQLVCFILNQFSFVTWKTARSVNVNLRTTQVHLVVKRRFF